MLEERQGAPKVFPCCMHAMAMRMWTLITNGKIAASQKSGSMVAQTAEPSELFLPALVITDINENAIIW